MFSRFSERPITRTDLFCSVNHLLQKVLQPSHYKLFLEGTTTEAQNQSFWFISQNLQKYTVVHPKRRKRKHCRSIIYYC